MIWAKVELDAEMEEFIEHSKDYVETFEEIKKLVFTRERLNTNYSPADMIVLSTQFQKIKHSAFNKILNKQDLNFSEGFVVERLLAKYIKQEYVPVEEHIQNIKLSCSNNRKSKRENKRKLSKMYLKKLCIKNGIPQVTVQGLRHIYASILIEQGVSLSKISALLGHSSIHTTFDIYCDVITAKEGITALINNIFTTEECS